MNHKKHVATYSQVTQISYDDYRVVRTSMIVTTETKVIDIMNWLFSQGVKSPDLTMIDFSYLDEGDGDYL